MNELDLSGLRQGYEGVGDFYEEVTNAIDRARDQDQVTWLMYDGEPVAVIVPVGLAMLGGALEAPARPGYGSPVRDRICIGCARPEKEPHEDWCPVVTGTLSSLPRNEETRS
jgi:hypothetical protein